jgi:hypothetical protein
VIRETVIGYGVEWTVICDWCFTCVSIEVLTNSCQRRIVESVKFGFCGMETLV